MADVILFRPRMSKGEDKVLFFSRAPLGLLFIASPLIENGYSVKIIDGENNFHWEDELNKELTSSTICVGVSSMTGRQISSGLKFSKIVKDRFNIPVVWGGLHASMLPEETVRNNLVDIVVRGEGEASFFKIVNAVKHGDSLAGIQNVWRKEGGRIYSNPSDQFVDLNTLSLPPYYLLDLEKIINTARPYFPYSRRILDLHTDRGCPHRCGFCYNININKRKWREMQASRVVEQVEHLAREYELDGINFVSDNFFVNRKRVADICAVLIKRKIKISWHADCRINYFAKYDDSFIGLLKASGCNVLTFGIESGSEKILNLINKDIKLDEVFKVNKKLKESGIGVYYHFMVGLLGESKKDVLETYRIMMRLRDEYPGANFWTPGIYMPFPGTPLYDRCVEKGFMPPERLEDWAHFEWDDARCPRFFEASYSKWLIESSNVIEWVFIRANGKYLRFIKQWARWWLLFISRFIAPRFELGLIGSGRAAAHFIKKM